jgi:hypothetical protein
VTKKMDLAAPGQEVSNELHDPAMGTMLWRKRKNLRIYQDPSHSRTLRWSNETPGNGIIPSAEESSVPRRALIIRFECKGMPNISREVAFSSLHQKFGTRFYPLPLYAVESAGAQLGVWLSINFGLAFKLAARRSPPYVFGRAGPRTKA